MTGSALAASTRRQTPIVKAGYDLWLKRDDLFTVAGVRGGKARTCLAIALQARDEGRGGLVTAGSRSSPQVEIVAYIARHLGLACRCHVPAGDATAQMKNAARAGAEVVPHRPGHNSVIVARAREDAKQLGWGHVPFGMECQEAIEQTSGQVLALPHRCTRIVVPVGSGMTLAGVLHGLQALTRQPAVLGVVVGAKPDRRLDRWAPASWRFQCELVQAGVPYARHVRATLGGVRLDPIYEAKAVRHLQHGDMLWVVGHRGVNGE